MPSESPSNRDGEDACHESRLPFGLIGSAILSGAALSIVILATVHFFGVAAMPAALLPGIFSLLAGNIYYNFRPSRFEKTRRPLFTCLAGGYFTLFHASWPLCRLLVYADGVETRVFFHRYFLPFDRLALAPGSGGFFDRGIRMACDLPGVPGNQRLAVRSQESVRARIQAAQRAFLGKSAPD